MKIILSGNNGRMGKSIKKNIANDCEIICGITNNPEKSTDKYPVYKEFSDRIDSGDVIIDFTVSDNIMNVLSFAVSKKIPLVMGTTGIDDKLKKEILSASKSIPILYSGNTSFGVSLMIHLIKEASKFLYSEYDIEIIEKHDKNKMDAPSGTSKMIINGICEATAIDYKILNGRNEESDVRKSNEIGLHSFRGGNIASEHYVSFVGKDEILEINHKAMSFDIFALGAIKAARFVSKMPSGLYTMEDMIKL